MQECPGSPYPHVGRKYSPVPEKDTEDNGTYNNDFLSFEIAEDEGYNQRVPETTIESASQKKCRNPYIADRIAVRIACYAATVVAIAILLYWIAAIAGGIMLYSCLRDGSCYSLETFTLDSLCADSYALTSGVQVHTQTYVPIHFMYTCQWSMSNTLSYLTRNLYTYT